MTVLQTSSESTVTKEIHVNHDEHGITYIDHFEHDKLVAAFTMRTSVWRVFVAAEAKRLDPYPGWSGIGAHPGHKLVSYDGGMGECSCRVWVPLH